MDTSDEELDLFSDEEVEGQETLLSIDSTGVHIVAPRVSEALAKKKISPSLITGLAGCPARWAAETFAIRELVEEEPDNAASRGQLFHKIMEDFFSLPGEERTTDKLKEIVREVVKSDTFSALNNAEAIQWLKDAITNYYSMGANPARVKVATVPSLPDKEGNPQEPRAGLEVFVKGKLGNAKREVLGFIDRVSEHNPADEAEVIEDAVVVEDWKTGARAKAKWNSKRKSEDGLPEARQQIIYTMLLEAMGVKVAEARLIFPVAKAVVEVDVNDEALRERAIADVEEADKALDHYIETNTFEFKPQFLCSWCPIARICPSAMRAGNDKARAAYRKQPTIDVLAKGIEILDS